MPPNSVVHELLQAGRAADIIVGATRLEGTAALPLYYRIGEAIISALNENRLPDMTTFPSDRVLGERMGVARNTVSGVRRYLHDRGHLEIHQGVRYLARATNDVSVRRRLEASHET